MGDCRCGHAEAAHEHYRRGSDCSACDCPQYDEQVTGWLKQGDVMRLPDDSLGQVVGLADGGRVLLRLTDGTIKAQPEDELRGTGLWMAVRNGEAG